MLRGASIPSFTWSPRTSTTTIRMLSPMMMLSSRLRVRTSKPVPPWTCPLPTGRLLPASVDARPCLQDTTAPRRLFPDGPDGRGGSGRRLHLRSDPRQFFQHIMAHREGCVHLHHLPAPPRRPVDENGREQVDGHEL